MKYETSDSNAISSSFDQSTQAETSVSMSIVSSSRTDFLDAGAQAKKVKKYNKMALAFYENY